MKNVFKLFGIIALVAVIGFSLAVCSGDDDGGGGGGGVPSGLIGNWGPSATESYVSFTISATKLITKDPDTGDTAFDISVTGQTITITLTGQGSGKFDFALQDGDKKLVATNGKDWGVFLTGGTETSTFTWYKK